MIIVEYREYDRSEIYFPDAFDGFFKFKDFQIAHEPAQHVGKGAVVARMRHTCGHRTADSQSDSVGADHHHGKPDLLQPVFFGHHEDGHGHVQPGLHQGIEKPFMGRLIGCRRQLGYKFNLQAPNL